MSADMASVNPPLVDDMTGYTHIILRMHKDWTKTMESAVIVGLNARREESKYQIQTLQELKDRLSKHKERDLKMIDGMIDNIGRNVEYLEAVSPPEGVNS